MIFLSLALFALAWCVICCLWFHARGAKIGRQQGYKQGYQEGFGAAREIAEIQANKWWLEADRDVERAREEMWREGL